MRNSSRVADRPRLSSTGLRRRPACLSSEKFCMLRAPIWITSAHSATRSRDSLSIASVTMRRPKRSRISGHDARGLEAQALKGVRRGAGLVSAAAEELRAGRRRPARRWRRPVPTLDGAGTGDDGQIASADGSVGSGKADDGVFFFNVAAGQFVGLGDADDLSDAGERFQIAAIDFALVAGDADGGALGSGKWMGTETQLLNMVADRLDLLRRGVRFHDD